jgi:hypothetical protein
MISMKRNTSGSWLAYKGTLFNSVPFHAYQPDMWKSVAEGPML